VVLLPPRRLEGEGGGRITLAQKLWRGGAERVRRGAVGRSGAFICAAERSDALQCSAERGSERGYTAGHWRECTGARRVWRCVRQCAAERGNALRHSVERIDVPLCAVECGWRYVSERGGSRVRAAVCAIMLFWHYLYSFLRTGPPVGGRHSTARSTGGRERRATRRRNDMTGTTKRCGLTMESWIRQSMRCPAEPAS
jgi:hypothetical protein